MTPFSTPDRSLTIFVAYQDKTAGKRAKETCDVLGGNLGQDWRVHLRLWSFKELALPRRRRLAALEAGHSDLIIISGQGQDLPRGLKLWARSCFSQELNWAAVVGLLEADESGAMPAIGEFLSVMAKKMRLPYFARVHPATAPEEINWRAEAKEVDA